MTGTESVENRWEKIKRTLTEAATQTLGKIKMRKRIVERRM